MAHILFEVPRKCIDWKKKGLPNVCNFYYGYSDVPKNQSGNCHLYQESIKKLIPCTECKDARKLVKILEEQ